MRLKQRTGNVRAKRERSGGGAEQQSSGGPTMQVMDGRVTTMGAKTMCLVRVPCSSADRGAMHRAPPCQKELCAVVDHLQPRKHCAGANEAPSGPVLARMASAGVPGFLRVHLPEDQLAKVIPAKAVKKIGGPMSSHPYLLLRPRPDRLLLSDQRVQECSELRTHVQPINRPLVQSQERNQNVTGVRKGCAPQRVQRVILDVPMGCKAHNDDARSGGGREAAIVGHHVREGRNSRPRLVSPT